MSTSSLRLYEDPETSGRARAKIVTPIVFLWHLSCYQSALGTVPDLAIQLFAVRGYLVRRLHFLFGMCWSGVILCS